MRTLNKLHSLAKNHLEFLNLAAGVGFTVRIVSQSPCPLFKVLVFSKDLPGYVRVSMLNISSNRFYFNCAPHERVRRCQSNESVIRGCAAHRCDLRRSICVIWCLSGGGGGAALGGPTRTQREDEFACHRVALNETKPLWARGLKKCGATTALPICGKSF